MGALRASLVIGALVLLAGFALQPVQAQRGSGEVIVPGQGNGPGAPGRDPFATPWYPRAM